MSNNLALAGATPNKQPRFAPIFTSRFFSGLWTNRSPLRDATTSRIVEKFYGQAGDALIAGSNVEITNKLTLARRPGTSVYDSNIYTGVDRFYSFRLFSPTTEQIDVMIDQANAIYSLYAGTKSLVFTKSAGAGQAYMQSVGNILFWGDSVDNKKWLQTLFTWNGTTTLGLAGSPFFTTFLIDPNGNIEQLVGSFVQCSAIAWGSGTLTATVTTNPVGTIAIGDTITFPSTMTATDLEGQNLVVTGVTSTTLTFAYINLTTPTYSGAESNVVLSDIGSGTPTTSGSTPTWSTTIPNAGNNFAGGITYDGSVIWVNRGAPVENWGIDISAGTQLKNIGPSSPSVTETIAGGGAGSTITSPGPPDDNNTTTTFSGFASASVSENVVVAFTLNATSTLTYPSSPDTSGCENTIFINISVDGGVTFLTYATYTFNILGSILTGGVQTLVNVPVSLTVSGCSNLSTLQVQLSATSSISTLVGTGYSATLSSTIGTISASTGNNAVTWAPSTAYGVGEVAIDRNSNLQTVTTGGTSGATEPNWSTVLGGSTTDNTVIWETTYIQAISASNGGYEYAIALVNSLDNTVSNATILSQSTGDFSGAQGILIPAGAGLPPIAQIDPQADYVAIFRTTDGQSAPFLIPGPGNYPWTIPLSQYLASGYLDHTLDTQLNNEISAAILGENTPPGAGAINLTYHLDRIWYSIGNTVYWTTGPATPVGNGVNGTSPLNFSSLPSLVKRIVPTSTGALIFTVSDIYIIQGNGTTASPIQSALPLIPGVGLLSYNALALNGPTIGFFTTDNQFIILDPSAGVSYAGLPIGDQFRQSNGQPGTNWNPANVYVTWHVEGEDQAWYVADGQFGWYRLMSAPAPESGYPWAPFATITNGVKAVQSIEVTPGVHRLLLGPIGTGELLQRNLSVFADNGIPYPANATIGSIVLAQPGQVAEVAHITIDAVRVGAPVVLGLMIDEALPYYTGPIDILKEWESDPPNLSQSRSFYRQRFYLSNSEEDEAAVMRDCQVQIIFSPYDIVQNELLTVTLFGAYSQEL